MDPGPLDISQDEEHLGALAMAFRGTRLDSERRNLANAYTQTVDRLIQSGNWTEMPAAEDQLPDAWMPKSFEDYWTRQLS